MPSSSSSKSKKAKTGKSKSRKSKTKKLKKSVGNVVLATPKQSFDDITQYLPVFEEWVDGFEVTKEQIETWDKGAGLLADSNRRDCLVNLMSGATDSPIKWLLNHELLDVATEKRIDQWHQLIIDPGAKSVDTLPLVEPICDTVVGADSITCTAADALIGLSAAHAINVLATTTCFSEWWTLIKQLLALSSHQQWDLKHVSHSTLIEQLTHVEIPLSLAFQLPEFAELEALTLPAAEKMVDMTTEILDNDGWPHARCLPVLGPLVASWARCFAIIREKRVEFHPDAESRLEWAVRQFARLIQSDERLAFGGISQSPITDECANLILKMSDDRVDRKLFSRVRTKVDKATVVADLDAQTKTKRLEKKKRTKAKGASKLPETSCLSEWSGSGVLQSRWKKGSPKLAFDYSGNGFHVEIGVAKALISGSAMPTIVLEGKQLEPLGDFSVVCDRFDEELDYVEFELNFGELRPTNNDDANSGKSEPVSAPSLKLNRQLVFSRNDDFVLIADCIVPESPGKVEYRCDWPLAEGITGLHETETREIYLQDKTIRALVLPLSLPEWKIERFDGQMNVVDGSIRLEQASDGAGMYVPMVVDLNPNRSRLKRTWRTLTVAEGLAPVRRDVAAAFRFQLDEWQWFFYRVISQSGNRTFLGENFNGEFVMNEFDEDGIVKELMRIE